jgi:hypothetical protein
MPAAISMRPAQPTDGEDAVPFIYSSGPAAFDYVFSYLANGEAGIGSPLEFLLRAFVDGRGEFGYRTHYVVLAWAPVTAAPTHRRSRLPRRARSSASTACAVASASSGAASRSSA